MPALGLSERKRRSTSNNVNNPSPPSSPVQPYTPNLGVVALSTTELPKANMASSTSYSPQVADESPDEATPGAIPHAWSSNGAGPSNSTTQLLTPQSPLSLPPSYVRPIPESPLTNPYLHPTLGAVFSPRCASVIV
ncbi:hypothetical protein DL93DRAFT_2074217 [Clavulina sp. PMI_390]|nr:hypothetical protein DL93DRAFT_2074217 [Clavulina sp. PMI_390]